MPTELLEKPTPTSVDRGEAPIQRHFEVSFSRLKPGGLPGEGLYGAGFGISPLRARMDALRKIFGSIKMSERSDPEYQMKLEEFTIGGARLIERTGKAKPLYPTQNANIGTNYYREKQRENARLKAELELSDGGKEKNEKL